MSNKFTRRQLMAGIGGGAAVTALAPLSNLSWAQMSSLRIGTSSTGSVFYTLGVGAGEIIRDVGGINTTVEPVGGSAANINALGQGNIDLAIANSFASYSGYTGTFAFKKRIGLRLVMQGHSSYRYMYTRKGSGIESAKDLEGKTIIGERRALPELRLIVSAMIEHFGLNESSMNIVATTNSGEALDAMRAGSVDAVVMPFSPRAGMIAGPMKDGVMQFLPMSVEDRDAILAKLPDAFYGVTQAANDFANQPEPVHLFSLNTYMISRPDIDDETMYTVAKAMYENVEKFGSYHATGKRWTAKRAVQKPALPFHPGVIRYLKEAGVWTGENDATQARLLKL